MFTGIITDIGKIVNIIESEKDVQFVIRTYYDLSTVELGASICCSGVCLTVISKDDNHFSVDVSKETLSCTNLGNWQKGTLINLERSLKLGDELGGHIVSGHVDGTANIISINEVAGSHEIKIRAPEEYQYYIAKKGSIAINGVSLTVNKIDGNIFSVNIIPHTWQNTSFKNLSVGDIVNFEIDTLARYVARLNENR